MVSAKGSDISMTAVSILTRSVLAWVVVSILFYPAKTMQAAATRGTAPIVYAAMGDSFTYSVGADDPATQSYPAVLARHLPRGAHFLNVGISGASLDVDRTYQLPQALAAHATLVTIWIGHNPYPVGMGAASSEPAAVATEKAELDQMLTTLQGKHVRVFVANEPAFMVGFNTPPSRADDALARTLNAAIAAAAARHRATVVDLYAVTKTIWGHPAYVVAGDGEGHLTAAGYKALAGVFYRVMHSHGAL
jgi:acyl-CoA thioesterase I